MEASTKTRRYTVAEVYELFPDDGKRYEIIDGVLHVTAEARLRHQRAIAELTFLMKGWVKEHGGDVFPGCNVDFAVDTHLEPDVVFLAPENAAKAKGLAVTFAPDLVVEVFSPSTWRYDLGEKRAALERFRVPEYWFVHLRRDEILVHRLEDDTYGPAAVYGRGQTITTDLMPGLAVDVDSVLGERDPDD